MIQPFHIAIPVQSLEPCRTFYRDILNCSEGRSTENWVDFNFFGHQLVIHQKDDFKPVRISNPVDGFAITYGPRVMFSTPPEINKSPSPAFIARLA